MAGKILKGLAVAAGTGLVIAFGSGRSRRETSTEPLLDRLENIEARVSAVEARFAEAAKEVPAILESILGPHVEGIRARLHAEMLESVETTLTRFERTIDSKVSLRMATIEKALTDQSAAIAAMSRREIGSDAHLQQLISAVERLCERIDAPPPAPEPMPVKEPSILDLPFENQLNEAMEREPDEGPTPTPERWQPTVVR
jgi:hypothetical protein